MKKNVILIAIMSLLLIFAVGCDYSSSQESNAKKTGKEKVKSPGEKKKNKSRKNKTALADSIAALSTEDEVTDPFVVDSTSGMLPEPEVPEEINWDVTALENDTISAENEIEMEEMAGDDEEIDEPEYEDLTIDEEFINHSEGDIPLRKEQILKSEIVKVKIPEYRDTKDSILDVIEERMTLHPQEASQRIVVEKWFSPVNFRGYKFNRKKLMLYGVEKNDTVSIYYYLGEYYFEFNNRMYYLDETTKNVGFGGVRDTSIINYLRSYDY